MAIPILESWQTYFEVDRNEGLGSSYERIVLNRKLNEIINNFGIKTCLEAPIFGFTGISGINSMELALKGINVQMCDHDNQRIRMIKEIWDEVGLNAGIDYCQDYSSLPYGDKQFDFTWNFSALWFVPDLSTFIKEVSRVTRKTILLCVPNRAGMGFISQKLFSGKKLKRKLFENNIVPKNFINMMSNYNWRLKEQGYIDSPPWPDIGMKKSDLIKKIGINCKERKKEKLSILSYYLNQNPDFLQYRDQFSFLNEPI